MKIPGDETAALLAACGANNCLTFSIHDLVHIGVSKDFPYSRSLIKELGYFKKEAAAGCDLFITDACDVLVRHASALTLAEQRHHLGVIEREGVQVLFLNGCIVMGCKRDPLPYVLPLIQWLLLQRGCSFVHAAAVALEGRGVLLPASGGVGKTTAISELCNSAGACFMADDLAIVSSDGSVLSFPKPLFLYPYHREFFPHVFQRNRAAIVPSWLSRPMAGVRRTFRPYLRRFPRVEDLARRHTPEHMHTVAREALPEVPFSDKNVLSVIIFLDRGSGENATLTEVDPESEVDRMSATLYLEMGEAAGTVVTACALTGKIPLHECFGRMDLTLRRAVRSSRAHHLEIPRSFDPRRTARVVTSAVQGVMHAGSAYRVTPPVTEDAPQALTPGRPSA